MAAPGWAARLRRHGVFLALAAVAVAARVLVVVAHRPNSGRLHPAHIPLRQTVGE
jgi:hypothetical protein